MADVIGSGDITLSDWARRTQDGKVMQIVEVLTKVNPILEDMKFKEGNLPTGHKTTIRSGLPSVTWRLLNYGVQPSKSRTVQVTDTCGNLEAYSEIDKDIADLNGNTSEFRWSEDKAFVQAMSNEMGSTIFYGNTNTDPEKFMGLSPRYNDSSAENAENLFNGGGTGSDNTSVWLVVWGEQTCHGIFPQGSKAGLQFKDHGEVTLYDAANGNYQGYRSHYKWQSGLTLKNWEYVVRLCNIDVSLLKADDGTVSSGVNLITNMIKMIHKIPVMGMGTPVFYCNEDVMTYLDLQTLKQTNMNVRYTDNPHGQPVMMFRGIPVKKCEALLSTESAISFS